MTMLFPPILEDKAIAISENQDYTIQFKIPDSNSGIGIDIKHIQVTLRYKSNGEYAINTNYSPDGSTIFLPIIEDYIEYREQEKYCTIKINKKFFRNKNLIPGETYLAQVRFGSSPLWKDGDLYTGEEVDFNGYSDWRNQQISQIPSAFGEWSNTQSVYCHGSAEISLNYNLKDFVPEIIYSYRPEFDDPIYQTKISYHYNTIYGNQEKFLISSGIRALNNYNLTQSLPIAPVQKISVSVEAITVNNTILFTELIIPPIGNTIGIPLLESVASIKDLKLYGEEIGDGVLAKEILISSISTEESNEYSVAVYRTNIFNFDTIKIYEDSLKNLIRIKDFSVEMGEDYQYIIILKENDIAKNQLISVFPWGMENPGYGRLMSMDSLYLDDNKHQLRLSGNVNVSSFKRNTSDSFQTTIGSKYPFYSRPGEINYRTLSINALISINFDPTSSFLRNDDIDGLWWDEDENSNLVILNRDLYSEREYSRSRIRVGTKGLKKEELVEYGLEKEDSLTEFRGPSSIYSDYYGKDAISQIASTKNDDVVYLERKFRDCVMEWLSNGKVKLLRSETEGNMIVILNGVSFTPVDKSSRIVYSMSASVTEIAEYNLENLIKYSLIPIEIKTHLFTNFPKELSIGDLITKQQYQTLLIHYPDIPVDVVDENHYRLTKDVDLEILQEILDLINEYSFLPGEEQHPIYEKMIFVNDGSFDIDNTLINEGGQILSKKSLAEGIKYNETTTFSYEILNNPYDFLTIGNDGKFRVSIKEVETKPCYITVKISNNNDFVYATVHIGALYQKFQYKIPSSSISLDVKETGKLITEIDIKSVFEISKGLKFNKLTGNPKDIDYIFSINENYELPAGLNLSKDGKLNGYFEKPLSQGVIKIKVEDATGDFKEFSINYGQIYQTPYLKQSQSIIDYSEVGYPIDSIDIQSIVVGGSRDLEYNLQKPAGGTLDNINIVEGKLSGSPSKSGIEQKIIVKIRDNELNKEFLYSVLFKDIRESLNFQNIRNILTPGNGKSQIKIGEVFEQIDILNYSENSEKINFVSGGVPFIDANGNEYYKFYGKGLLPDYSISSRGIYGGMARVGTATGREATLSVEDALGNIVGLKVLIPQILGLLSFNAEGLILELPEKYSKENYEKEETIIIGKDRLSGGIGPYTLSFTDNKISENGLRIIDNNDSWTITNDGQLESLNKNLRTLYFSDSNNEKLSFNIVQNKIFVPLNMENADISFNKTPLNIGENVIGIFNNIQGDNSPFNAIVQGISGAELSIDTKTSPAQSPNDFYLQLKPTGENITFNVILTDKTGKQSSKEFKYSATGDLDFEIINDYSDRSLLAGVSIINQQIISGIGFGEEYTYEYQFVGTFPVGSFENGYFKTDENITANLNQTKVNSQFKVDVYSKDGEFLKSISGLTDNKHTWTSPRVYAQPKKSEDLEIGYLIQDTPFSSSAIFTDGIGDIYGHPKLEYYIKNGEEYKLINYSKEIITNSNIFFNKNTAILESNKIGNFEAIDLEIVAGIEYGENQEMWYSEPVKISFKGIEPTMEWLYFSKDDTLLSRNKILNYSASKFTFDNDEKDLKFEFNLNGDKFSEDSNGYYYKSSGVQKTDQLIVELVNSEDPNWSFNYVSNTGIGILVRHFDEPTDDYSQEVKEIKIKNQTLDQEMFIRFQYNGARKPLTKLDKFTIPAVDLKSLSQGEFRVQDFSELKDDKGKKIENFVSGGSGIYGYYLKPEEGSSVDPYGAESEIFTENGFKQEKLKIDNYFYPERGAKLLYWDRSYEATYPPTREGISVTLGEIKGLPRQIKNFEDINLNRGTIFEYEFSEYFNYKEYIENDFSIEVLDGQEIKFEAKIQEDKSKQQKPKVIITIIEEPEEAKDYTGKFNIFMNNESGAKFEGFPMLEITFNIKKKREGILNVTEYQKDLIDIKPYEQVSLEIPIYSDLS